MCELASSYSIPGAQEGRTGRFPEQCCGSMDPWIRDPGSGAFFDPGSRILVLKPIFLSLVRKFWVKITIIYSVLAKKFLYLCNTKIIYNFMIFVATKNGRIKLLTIL
jgi:hypothetical protein